jgi:putative ABC transport system substrate-binding protein
MVEDQRSHSRSEGAFTAMRNERVEALLVLDVPIPIIHQKQIAELAATYRLPTMFLGGRRMSEAGGLIAYGAGLLDILPRIPVYVEKILGGAKPGDLPIEVLKQPILIFNLKAARTIGITIPPELLKRADQVVE